MSDKEIDCQDCEGSVNEKPQVVDESVEETVTKEKRRIRVTAPKPVVSGEVDSSTSKSKRERSEKQREAFLRCQEARKTALQRVKDGVEPKPERKAKKAKIVRAQNEHHPQNPTVIEKVIERVSDNPVLIESIVRGEMEKMKESISKPVNEILETVKRTQSVRVTENTAAVKPSQEEKTVESAPVNAANVLPNTRANSRRQVYYDMLKAEIMK